MNKVNVEKALKLLEQGMAKQLPYKLPPTPPANPTWVSSGRMKPLPGEYSPDIDPEDWEPQDD